ncbi:MAG: hypothetical protein WCD70_01275, partial [Alphaproteobacteria bacterium]
MSLSTLSSLLRSRISGGMRLISFSSVAVISAFIVCTFIVLGMYSLLLLRDDETSLYNFNAGIVKQKESLEGFQAHAHFT